MIFESRFQTLQAKHKWTRTGRDGERAICMIRMYICNNKKWQSRMVCIL